MTLAVLPGEFLLLLAVVASLCLMIIALLTYEIRRLRRQVKGLRFVQRVHGESWGKEARGG